MRASDLMTSKLATLDEDATVGDAMGVIAEHEVRHVPILRKGRVLGMLSDRDLRRVEGLIALTVAAPEGSGTEVLKAKATTLLSADLITVSPDTDVDEIIDRLLGEGVGAVAVVDGEHTLLGIVSYVDVLRAARGKLG